MKTIITCLLSLFLIFNSSIIYSQYTEQEKTDLLFTLQEEKLAYDFYSDMYTKYNSKVFENIMEAEKVHQQHVLDLLNNLNIDVGDFSSAAGEYSNKDIQELYNMLSEIGSYSYTDALRAATKYEEQDIQDLRNFYNQSENQQVKDLYGCLEKATHNHLRAFVKNLKKEGINYKPKVLSEDDYNTIINSEKETGNCFQNN